MRKNSRTARNSGAYTSSPGTPEFEEKNGTANPSIRRHVALMPFNSGRALPSKWDDAERWITSPVSSYGSAKSPIPRPLKSKSGPISAYSSQCGPNSPLTTGVLLSDGFPIRYDYAGAIAVLDEKNTATSSASASASVSVPGFGDLLSGQSSSQDDKPDGAKEEAVTSHGVDMATQMSPDGSSCSSSKGRLSFSALPFSGLTTLHQNSNSAAKDEVRDVQVDKGMTATTVSKKRGVKKRKDATHIEDLPLPWNASEASESTSKLLREEAKITAWENLQKAKAEAAIQKLEVKLEKKRSASMDRILSKLRASEMKAQDKRNLLSKKRASRPRTGSSRRGFRSSCFLCLTD